MKKYLAIILTILVTITLYSQGAPNIGNNGILYWQANPPEDGVIRYNIYLTFISPPIPTRLVATTTTTNIPTSNFIDRNGTVSVCVSAINVNGEGPTSTNVTFKYFANKPIQVVGVDAK